MSTSASPPLPDPFAPLWPFHRSLLGTLPNSPKLRSVIGGLSDEDISFSREGERPFSERSVLTRIAIACDSAAQQAQDHTLFAHLYLPLLYVSDSVSFEEGSGSLEGLVERPPSAGSSISVVLPRSLSSRLSLPLTAIRGVSGGHYKEFVYLLEDLGLKPVITCPGPGVAQLCVHLQHGANMKGSAMDRQPLSPEHIAALRCNREKLLSLPTAFLASELGLDLRRFTGLPLASGNSQGVPESAKPRRTSPQRVPPKRTPPLSARSASTHTPDSASRANGSIPAPCDAVSPPAAFRTTGDRDPLTSIPRRPTATSPLIPEVRPDNVVSPTPITTLQAPKAAPASVVLLTFDSAPPVSRDSNELCRLLEQLDGAFPDGHAPTYEGFSLLLELRHNAQGFNALFFRDDWPFDPSVNFLSGGAITAWRLLEAKGHQPLLLLCPHKTRAVIGITRDQNGQD